MIKDADLKNLWDEASGEKLDGYFVKGWHYPDADERAFLFVLGIQRFLANDKYVAPAYTKEEVQSLNTKAANLISNIFGISSYGNQEKEKQLKSSPAVMLKLAELVIKDLSQKNSIKLDEPSI